MEPRHTPVPVFAFRFPAIPDTGCIVIAAGCVAWFCTAVIVFTIIFGINSGEIVARVSRSILFPAFEQALAPQHSSEQRQAFSNAFMRYADEQQRQKLFQTGHWTYPALNNLVQASRDGTLSCRETAAFVSSVWYHAGAPQTQEAE